jgi:single-stranded DNA-binding protein
MMSRGIEAALWGSATRDADIRTSKSGSPFGILDLKTHDDGATADGKPNTVFVRILAFGQHVDAARAIKRGDRVYVEGQLQVSIWQSDNNAPRLNLTIKAFTVQKTGIGKSRPPRPDRTSWQAPIGQSRSATPPFNDTIDF